MSTVADAGPCASTARRRARPRIRGISPAARPYLRGRTSTRNTAGASTATAPARAPRTPAPPARSPHQATPARVPSRQHTTPGEGPDLSPPRHFARIKAPHPPTHPSKTTGLHAREPRRRQSLTVVRGPVHPRGPGSAHATRKPRTHSVHLSREQRTPARTDATPGHAPQPKTRSRETQVSLSRAGRSERHSTPPLPPDARPRFFSPAVSALSVPREHDPPARSACNNRDPCNKNHPMTAFVRRPRDIAGFRVARAAARGSLPACRNDQHSPDNGRIQPPRASHNASTSASFSGDSPPRICFFQSSTNASPRSARSSSARPR